MAYSAANAANPGGFPTSGGRVKAGPSVAKVMRPMKSSGPSGRVTPVSAGPASLSWAQDASAVAAVRTANRETKPGD